MHDVMCPEQIKTRLDPVKMLGLSFFLALGLHVFFFLGICVLMPEEYYSLGSTCSAGLRAETHARSFKKHAKHVATPDTKNSFSPDMPEPIVESEDNIPAEETCTYLPLELRAILQKYCPEQNSKNLVVKKTETHKKRVTKKTPTPAKHKKIEAPAKKEKPVTKQKEKKPRQPAATKTPTPSVKKPTKTSQNVLPSKKIVPVENKKDVKPSKVSSKKPQTTISQNTVTTSVQTRQEQTAPTEIREKAAVAPKNKDNSNNTFTNTQVPSNETDNGDGSDNEANSSDNGHENDIDDSVDSNADDGAEGDAGTIAGGDYIEIEGPVKTTGGLASEYQKTGAAELGDFLNKHWTTPAGCQDAPPVEIDATVDHDGILAIDAIRISSVPIKNYAAKKFLSQIPSHLLKAIAGLKIKLKFL